MGRPSYCDGYRVRKHVVWRLLQGVLLWQPLLCSTQHLLVMSTYIRIILILCFLSARERLSGGLHCSVSTLHSPVAGLEARYDP